MIKTHKGYLQRNYPRIITKENKKGKRKEKEIEAEICLNCTKKKCSGTKECFERMKKER